MALDPREPATIARPSRIGHVLPYVPAEPLADALPQMGALSSGARVAVATLSGAALLVDVAGFSALARHLVHSDAASAAEQLCAVLNEYIGALVARLHAHGAEVLLFAGDAVLAFIAARPGGRSLRAAAEEALAVALELRGMVFEREGYTLTCHTGVGAGALAVHAARAEGRLQALYGGELVAQAAAAQRASARDDVVLSGEAAALLQIRGEELPAPPGRPPLVRLPASYRLAPTPPRTPDHGGRCGCGAPARGAREAAAVALEGYGDEILALAPATVPAAGAHGASFWVDELRTIFCVFASFPELDGGTAADAERFGAVARAVVRVADEFGGELNKLFVDDKGCSALIGFGLAGHAHEDDAERAVRSALALRKWFEAADAPFACGVAAGRTFSGTLGAPCRREHALIGDCVIVAARLMSAARESVAAAGGRGQHVLCDRSVAEAAAGLPGCSIAFEGAAPIQAKGFASLLAAFRPRADAAGASRDASDASAAAVARSWKCMGREAELAAVSEAVEAAARHGRGATVVIEAEAGHGKTRLLEEAERLCAERGVVILRCAARRLEDSTPLLALRGAVASLADCSSPEAMRAGLRRAAGLSDADAAALWGALFEFAGPEYGAKEDEEKPVSQPRPEPADAQKSYRAARAPRTGRGQLGYHVAGVQAAAALAKLVAALERGGRAVTLLLEDAHWADSATVFVLRCLRAVCPRLLLLITSRPMEEPPRDHLLLSGRAKDEAAKLHDEEAAPTVVDVCRLDVDDVSEEPVKSTRRAGEAPAVTLLSLGPLGEEAARRLLEDLLGGAGLELPPATADLILRKAAGVPLYLVELCRQLQQARDAGNGGAAAELAVPDSVQQLILARADRLSGVAQAALKLCAIAAAGFTQETIAAIDPSGMGPAVVRAAFAELARAGLIVPEASVRPSEADGRIPPARRPYSFVHALMREAVYGALPEAQRREAHARLARFLEAGAPDEADPAVLAAHWRDAGEVERALPHLERAARQAAAQNALPESRALFSELCLAIDDLGLAGPAAPQLRPSLQSFAPPAAARRARRASTAGPPAPAEQERWRARLGCALRSWAQAEYFIGRLEPAADIAAVCTETLLGWRIPYGTPVPLLSARLVWTVLRLGHSSKAPPAEGRGWLQQPAQREARVALLDAAVIVGLCSTKGAARMRGDKGGFMLAVLLGLRACEVSRGTPAAEVAIADIRIRGMWISLLDYLGMRRLARSNLPFFEETVRGIGDPYALLWIHNHRGAMAARVGRIRESARCFRLSLQTHSASPIAADARVNECTGLALLGSFAEAEVAVDEAADFFRRYGMDESAASLVGTMGAWADLLTGREGRAARRIHRARALLLAQSRGSLWSAEIVRVLAAVLEWRRGGLPAAVEAMEATAAFWRMQAEARAVVFFSIPAIVVLVDFACWWRARALARLRAARPPGRPSPRRVAPAPADGAPLEELEAEAARAAAFAGGVLGLLEETTRRRLPALAPFAALARAHEPRLAPARRLRLLREARDGFARSELRPWEALAALQLARAEPDPAAAAEAAAAAARVCAETGLRLSPSDAAGGYLSLWV